MGKPKCGAVAPAVIGIVCVVTCDRELGHKGPHRGYVEQVDDVLFWAR